MPLENSGTETLLIVENEHAIRNLLQVALRRNGYTVLVAGSGSEALTLAQNHAGAIHLLITDIVMPDMDGPELVKRLSTIRPGTRTLFMSGYVDNTFDDSGILFTDANFIQKPFPPSTIARKIRKILDGVEQ